jgi:hypothetical protein
VIQILQVFFYFVVTIFVDYFRKVTELPPRGLNLSGGSTPVRVVQIAVSCNIHAEMVRMLILAFVIFFRRVES